MTTSGMDRIRREYLRVRALPCGFRPLAPPADDQIGPPPAVIYFKLEMRTAAGPSTAAQAC